MPSGVGRGSRTKQTPLPGCILGGASSSHPSPRKAQRARKVGCIAFLRSEERNVLFVTRRAPPDRLMLPGGTCGLEDRRVPKSLILGAWTVAHLMSALL